MRCARAAVELHTATRQQEGSQQQQHHRTADSQQEEQNLHACGGESVHRNNMRQPAAALERTAITHTQSVHTRCASPLQKGGAAVALLAAGWPRPAAGGGARAAA
eukprot:COSAG01_NODE_4122_length_5331_cov_11.476873_9_plen_104_part_01